MPKVKKRKMGKETNIGIILNTSKEEAIKSTHKIVDLLKKAGLEYFLLREEAVKCDLSRVGLEKEDFLKKISTEILF